MNATKTAPGRGREIEPPAPVKTREAAINLLVGEERRKKLRYCALVDDVGLQEWCIEALDKAMEERLRGTKLPFEQPATPFRIPVMV